VRVEKVAGSPGRFAAFRSSDGINWIAHTQNTNATNNTNDFLADGTIQIGVGGGAIGTLAGARTQFDFVEIETQAAPPCTICNWNINGSGDWNRASRWGPATISAPNANTTTAVFGSTFTGTAATIYSDAAVTIKELRFTNATSKYVLAGTGQITLDADSGNALIDVQAGNHEIQIPLSLADNVTATAAPGTSLNINASVVLNGNVFGIGGSGTINLNNGTIAAGVGGGSVVNGGSLTGLSSVEGDLSQTSDGSLGIAVGGGAVNVTGAAVLDGVLDVSLADGFTPSMGQTYTVLTAESVVDQGLTLAGDAKDQFRLVVASDSVSLAAVPEPSAALLLLLGGCGFYRLFRRRLNLNQLT
jgi:hypothetical protein